MTINVLLDINIVLDLLLKRGPDYYRKAELFTFLRQKKYPLFFAACALPSLEYIHTKEIERLADEGLIKSSIPPGELARQQLTGFMEAVIITPSLGSHWRRIPQDHPDREHALISLSSAELPGPTFIWTSDEDFCPAAPEIAFGDSLALQQYMENITQSNLPFVDLGCQQGLIRENLEKGIFSVLRHGNYIMGPEVKKLESKLAEYVGIKHAIGCASGTDALLMALLAYGVGPGDAIFTTAFTFIATADVISLLGATPVFVDIDPVTFNIDPKKLEQAIRAVESGNSSLHVLPNQAAPLPFPQAVARQSDGKVKFLTPRGIIPVDLFGLPADYEAINAIAKGHGLFVIEDAAQSFGAEFKGKKACSLADIACTSFFPAKPLGCYGDGGMCFTADDNLAGIMRSILVHGKGGHKYDNVRIGINGRIDTLQAAILLAKFDIFPEEVTLRQAAAQRYTALLTSHSSRCTPDASLLTPHIPDGYKSVWTQYSILAKSGDHRTVLQKSLQENKIPTAIYYPKPLHLQTAFASLGYEPGAFPISENVASRIFSIPMHPYLDAQSQEAVVKAINHACLL
jgi:UDP-2-acetamido-2-deoxy-ribo-hexuluronate aminotransferase